tara:strand:- start:115 stop:654 length:540 start_codon:yes stop_codon:yes gene_type:complete
MGVNKLRIATIIRGTTTTFKSIQNSIKLAFTKVKEELEDHLTAINENTNEIQSNYEYTCELESKIEKLNERVEQLQLTVYGQIQAQNQKISEKMSAISPEEKSVFIALYTLEEEKGSVTFEDIALSTKFTTDEVSNLVSSLIDKEIPISKKIIDNKPYLKIDKDFKMLQAKQNVLNIVH